MIEISGGNYRILYDPSAAHLAFRGVLRLYGTDGYVSANEYWRSRQSQEVPSETQESSGGYTSIMKLLSDIVEQSPDLITLDLTELQFLNSSGINLLSKFVIMIRNQGSSRLAIQGNSKLSWQKTVVKNFKALMPSLLLTFE